MDRIIVIGAGVTGMTAAYELSSLGAEITVVERESYVGGNVLDYCCKATSSCARCGVCLAITQIDQTLRDPCVELYTGSVIEEFTRTGSKVSVRIRQRRPSIDYAVCTSCDACINACPVGCITRYERAELVQYIIDYNKCLRAQGKPCSACADACAFGAIAAEPAVRTFTETASSVVVATGHVPYDPARRAEYGYGRSERILSGLEAEVALADAYNFGDPAERVAFVQCVGSRDPSIGRNFCSGVCCAYALRMARQLKYRNPDMPITVFYIDLQNFDREFSAFRHELEELGVEFRQGVPFRIEEHTDGSLAFFTPSEKADCIEYFDRAILSVGIDQDPEADGIAEMFGITRNEHGFFEDGGNGVIACGTCNRPMSIPESMAAARAAAYQIWSSR